jgi:hypothetical protein
VLFGCCCRQQSAMYLHGIPHVFARVWRRTSVWSAHQVRQADDQVEVFCQSINQCYTCQTLHHGSFATSC